MEKDIQKRDGLLSSLERLFKLSPDMIGQGDLHGYFHMTNPAFKEILGYSAREVTSCPFLSFVHPEDYEKTHNALKAAAEGKREIFIQNRYKCKDGSYKWIEWKVRAWREENRFIAFGRDITESRKAEKELQDLQKAMDLAQKMAGIGYWSYDRDTGNRAWSSQMFINFGLSPELGSPRMEDIKNAFHPDEWDFFEKKFQDALDGASYDLVLQIRHSDGTPHFIHTQGYPIIGDSGKITGLFGTSQDVTRRILAETALSQSEEKYRLLYQNAGFGIGYWTPDGKVISFNTVALDSIGAPAEDLQNKSAIEIFGEEMGSYIIRRIARSVETNRQQSYEDTVSLPGGEKVFLSTYNAVRNATGEVLGVQIISVDITEKKNLEKSLQEHKDLLEKKVVERTNELADKSKKLEDLNIALKVLIEKKEEDQIDFENRISSNINNLINPYLEKLKRCNMDDKIKTLVDILESNLNEILSPFSYEYSAIYNRLSPREIRIANLVKQGKTTKEIARILHLSSRTVGSYRANIRKKLGINHSSINLHSYLLSL